VVRRPISPKSIAAASGSEGDRLEAADYTAPVLIQTIAALPVRGYRHGRTRLVGALAFIAAGCGAAHAADAGAPSARSDIAAIVTDVQDSNESAMYVTVTVEFRNPSKAPVTIRQYAIEWPKGRFVASQVAIALGPGTVVTRRSRVGWDSGPVDRLTVNDARVSVLR
jgi:hypothetical protein